MKDFNSSSLQSIWSANDFFNGKSAAKLSEKEVLTMVYDEAKKCCFQIEQIHKRNQIFIGQMKDAFTGEINQLILKYKVQLNSSKVERRKIAPNLRPIEALKMHYNMIDRLNNIVQNFKLKMPNRFSPFYQQPTKNLSNANQDKQRQKDIYKRVLQGVQKRQNSLQNFANSRQSDEPQWKSGFSSYMKKNIHSRDDFPSQNFLQLDFDKDQPNQLINYRKKDLNSLFQEAGQSEAQGKLNQKLQSTHFVKFNNYFENGSVHSKTKQDNKVFEFDDKFSDISSSQSLKELRQKRKDRNVKLNPQQQTQEMRQYRLSSQATANLKPRFKTSLPRPYDRNQNFFDAQIDYFRDYYCKDENTRNMIQMVKTFRTISHKQLQMNYNKSIHHMHGQLLSKQSWSRLLRRVLKYFAQPRDMLKLGRELCKQQLQEQLDNWRRLQQQFEDPDKVTEYGSSARDNTMNKYKKQQNEDNQQYEDQFNPDTNLKLYNEQQKANFKLQYFPKNQ